jgi:hypothetical protein
MGNSFYWELRRDASKNSRLFEVALVLVRFDHVARLIVNANHGIMLAALSRLNRPRDSARRRRIFYPVVRQPRPSAVARLQPVTQLLRPRLEATASARVVGEHPACGNRLRNRAVRHEPHRIAHHLESRPLHHRLKLHGLQRAHLFLPFHFFPFGVFTLAPQSGSRSPARQARWAQALAFWT